MGREQLAQGCCTVTSLFEPQRSDCNSDTLLLGYRTTPRVLSFIMQLSSVHIVIS